MSELLVLDGPPARSRFRLAKLSEQLGGGVELYAEFVHLLWVASALDDATLTRSRALLRYGPERDLPQKSGVLAATVVPRAGTISPWSSKATDIFHLCGLTQIRRVERGVRWYTADGQVVPGLEALAVDRMTQRVVTESQLPTIFAELPARPMVTVALGAEGPSALQRANNDLGLALSAEEVDYLVSAYLELQRDPTDVELMMFAQANSEHCRHKIFNASWEIDGEAQALSLFAMIRNTHKQINGEGILSAYSDNAAVISGHRVSRFGLMDDDCYRYDDADVHILMKVETHNHPTAIAPYPGAATGSGGEIRDEGAVGRGSKPKAGLTGFTTSHLNIPDYAQPWELGTGKPEHMVSALDIMLEGPIGAAGFNNEYGRPALAGYFRTFEQAAQDGSGLVRGYHKPVMIAGGVGSVRGEHINAVAFPPQAKVIVLGGPAMLIGLGGGAASSMGSGESRSDLDFASVQRENPEMERRCQEVIDRCCALGDANPILLIHDVGAGGLSNALPELVSDAERGGNFALRAVPNADPGMTPLEIWCNESQERYVMAVAAEDLELFAQICDRERCPFAVVGEASEVQRLRLSDAQFDNNPVDIPLSVLFGKPPKMQRSFQRGRPTLAALDTRPIELDHAIEQVLRFPAVASKHFLITIGDRSITGLVAREQMVGPWQVPVADAAVTFAGFRDYVGEAFAIGERSPLALIDAAASARMAIAEALTNLCCASVPDLGRVVLSANWMAAAGSDLEEQALFDGVHAAGMELCPALGIAVPVGKDSLSMRTRWDGGEVSSPMTLIASAFAPVADVRRTLTPEIKPVSESRLLLIDLSAGKNRLGGSVLAQCYGQLGDSAPDLDDPNLLREFFAGMQQLGAAGLLLAYHDRSDGGLLACVLEMAFAGRCGVDLQLNEAGMLGALFAEELGAVIQVAEASVDTVARTFPSLRCVDIGTADVTGRFSVTHGGELVYQSDRAYLQSCWTETSYRMQRLRDNPDCADEEFAAIASDDPGLSAVVPFVPDDDLSSAFAIGRRPRIAVLREQGVNGQIEMAAAFERAGFDPIDVHMSDLLSGSKRLDDFAALVACGGFSYGDVLGGGGGWAKSALYHESVSEAFADFFAGDRLVLGVCNGCQMLSQLKDIIPAAGNWPRFVRNRSEQFEGRTVLVRINHSDSPWLAGMADSVLPIAVAHGEGRAEFAAAGATGWSAVEDQVCMQYVDNHHEITEVYPANPNGAINGLAGLTAAQGRVLVMMPHPERVFRAYQNAWRDESWREDGPWMRLFRNARCALG